MYKPAYNLLLKGNVLKILILYSFKARFINAQTWKSHLGSQLTLKDNKNVHILLSAPSHALVVNGKLLSTSAQHFETGIPFNLLQSTYLDYTML